MYIYLYEISQLCLDFRKESLSSTHLSTPLLFCPCSGPVDVYRVLVCSSKVLKIRLCICGFKWKVPWRDQFCSTSTLKASDMINTKKEILSEFVFWNWNLNVLTEGYHWHMFNLTHRRPESGFLSCSFGAEFFITNSCSLNASENILQEVFASKSTVLVTR